ncbi:hypothetical protein QR680_019206 [Steinernema hermaphroditum]|uniref:Nose resistant-to-fluoxetine protein N-terminal domain-containing protein n=1 Tax=Steinernema hermaphroditum TaxID=289476 RepID=A0AA39HLB3_9BILA|nr:hypothetical protein QR680_019206 [Steinernema hermaphroditum]
MRFTLFLCLFFVVTYSQDVGLFNKAVQKFSHKAHLNESLRKSHFKAASQVLGRIENLLNGPSREELSVVNDLLYNVPSLNLSENCRRDIIFWTSSFRTFWTNQTIKKTDYEFAVRQLDAFGKPPAGLLKPTTQWMGSWDECLSVKAPMNDLYKTKYCWAKVAASNPNSRCDNGLTVDVGTCMPATCSNNDIVKVLNQISSTYRVCSSECRVSSPPSTATFWIVSVIMVLVSALVILGSYVDYFIVCDQKHKDFSISMRLLLCFSIYTNGAELLNTETKEGQIDVVHCIRFFSMAWVIAGHGIFLCFIIGYDNLTDVLELRKYFLNLILLNGFFSVDSFFFLSGLLLAYLFFKEASRNPKRIKSPITWVLFYVHRFLRLTPPYIMLILFFVAYMKHLTIGPLQLHEDQQVQNCVDNWWTNVLYVNNLVNDDRMCYGVTWYLSADMQMYIFSPLLLIAFFINHRIGLALSIGILVASTGVNYGTFYKYHFYPSMLHIDGIGLADDKENDQSHFIRLNYQSSWIRCLPYIVGMLTGYYLQKYKEVKLRIKPLHALTGWAACFACALGSVFGLYGFYNGADWSVFTRASYNNFSRLGWSLSLSYLTVACQKGFAGPIKNIMSLKMFIPLSRLSYCAYLTHLIVLWVYISMWRSPLHYVTLFENYVHIGLPCTIIAYLAALVWSLMFEVPFAKVEKIIIDGLMGQKPRKQYDDVKDANGLPPANPLVSEAKNIWTIPRPVLACLAHINLVNAIYLNCAYFALWKAYDIFWFWMHLVLCVCIPPLRPENFLIVWCNLIWKKCTKYPRRSYKQIYNLLYNFKGTKAEHQLQRLKTIELKERQKALESSSSSSSSDESVTDTTAVKEQDPSKFNVFVNDADANGDVRQSRESAGGSSLYPSDLLEDSSTVEVAELPTIDTNENASKKENLQVPGDNKSLSWADRISLQKIPFRFRLKRSISAELKETGQPEVISPNYSNRRDLFDKKALEKREKKEKKALEKKLRKRRKEELAEMARIERKRKTVANAIDLLLQCLRMITSFAILIGNIRKTFIPAHFQYLPPGRHAWDNNDIMLFFRISVFLDVAMFWINTMRTMCMQWHLCYRLGILKFWLWASLLGFLGGFLMVLPMHYVYEQLDVSWCHFKPNTTLSQYQPKWR